jgi:hypothetical protein
LRYANTSINSLNAIQQCMLPASWHPYGNGERINRRAGRISSTVPFQSARGFVAFRRLSAG